MNLVCYMPKFVVRVSCSVVAVYNASEHLDVPFCSIVTLISAAVPFEKPRVLQSFSFTFTIEIQQQKNNHMEPSLKCGAVNGFAVVIFLSLSHAYL